MQLQRLAKTCCQYFEIMSKINVSNVSGINNGLPRRSITTKKFPSTGPTLWINAFFQNPKRMAKMRICFLCVNKHKLLSEKSATHFVWKRSQQSFKKTIRLSDDAPMMARNVTVQSSISLKLTHFLQKSRLRHVSVCGFPSVRANRKLNYY